MTKYTIDWSSSDRLMTIVLRGFWNDDDAASYGQALSAAVARIGTGQFDLIADVSDLMTQSQQTILTYGEMARLISAAGIRQIIIINIAPLLHMQLKRAAATLPFEQATSMAQARAMLTQDQTSA